MTAANFFEIIGSMENINSDNCCPGHKIFESRGLNNQEQKVENIKQLAGMLWQEFDEILHEEGSEAPRLISLAKTHLESSVMWGVKACSRSKLS